MGRKVTVATCALNQWALDFEGNLQRILKSESRVGVGWTGEGQFWSSRFAVKHTQPCSGETCGHGYRDPDIGILSEVGVRVGYSAWGMWYVPVVREVWPWRWR